MKPDRERPPRSLKELVQKAEERFWSKDVIVNPYGRFEAYTPHHAASEIFAEYNINGAKILPRLLRETKLQPPDLQSIEDVLDAQSWEELFSGLAKQIVIEEFYKRPGIEEERDRRIKTEADFDYPEI